MTPKLLAKYGGPVPRYTSYPTAPHFGPAVNAETYARWLAALDPGEPVSLYFHVPYCDTLCWFCGCHTKIVRRYEPIAAYLTMLEREVDLVADVMAARLPVRHVHFGGGSPTIVEGGDFACLMDHVRERFRLVPEAEVAVEIDPRGMTREAVAALAAAGVNRASLGVQDFDPEVQAAINRVQSFEETANVAGWLREAGVDGLNVDLMYGLPLQTVEKVERTLDQALSLRPDRVALFGYAHVPWMKRHQRLIHDQDLPGGDERWDQYEAARARLIQGGYVAIGLDHFANPDDPLAGAADSGRLRRNFQGYTTDQAPALIGFGASAIGALPQGYVQNEPAINTYERVVGEGRFAAVRGVALDDDDRLRRDIIERLMCDLAVDLSPLCRRRGRAAQDFAAELSALEDMQADGLVEVDGSHIRVTEIGQPLVRTVAAVFDRYLPRGEGRHSRAV